MDSACGADFSFAAPRATELISMKAASLLPKLTLLLLLTHGVLAEEKKPAALPPASATPVARQPITHEALWLLKRVGPPTPSPDGKWVVFSVIEPAYDAKEQVSDLWLKSLTDESPARKITFTKGAEGNVAWSQDGSRLAFDAKRDGDEVAQIHVLNLAAGGEAERVTSLSLGARQPKWSPDGKRLLFVSDTFPGCLDEEANKKAAKEAKDRKYKARAYESFPPRFWDQWLDEKRPHLFVQDAVAGAKAQDLFAGTKFGALKGVGGRPDEAGEMIEALWMPDGTGIVFAMAVNRDESARANVRAQIFALPLGGGEPANLTSDQRSYRSLAFAPDGKALFCLTSEERADTIYGLDRLTSFPWPFESAKRRVLTAALDRSVSRFALPEKSDRVWFSFEHAGLEKLYSMPLAGGAVREERSPVTGCVSGLAAGGARLIANWDSATTPPEVFEFSPAGAAPKPLTNFGGARVAALDLAPVEHFTTTSRRGEPLHSMLVRPAGFDAARKYPLLVVMHGGAASMWRDAWVLRWNYHLLAAPGYAVLLTDYSGSTGYGEAFTLAIQNDPLKGPGDDLLDAADDALKRFPFLDPARQAAAGASYGGHLANWLQATTTRFKCIVSHAGEMDLVMQWGTSDSIFGREVNSGGPPWADARVWREQSPLLQAGNHDKGTGFLTPILITVGEQDFRVPVNNALMNFAVQQRLQVPSKLIVFPEENHWIRKGEESRYWFSEVHAWLAKWLK